MPDLTPSQTRALGFWGVIEHATAQRLPTAELWRALRDAAGAAEGEPLGFGAADVSVIRGYANRIATSAAAFNTSDPGVAVDASMVAQAPWARPPDVQNAAPRYQVRYLANTLDPSGNPAQEWRTSMFSGQLPTTVQGVLDAVEQDAIGVAAEYGHSLLGVDSLQLLAV